MFKVKEFQLWPGKKACHLLKHRRFLGSPPSTDTLKVQFHAEPFSLKENQKISQWPIHQVNEETPTLHQVGKAEMTPAVNLTPPAQRHTVR